MSLLLSILMFLRTLENTSNPSTTISIRHQTNGNSCRVINLPNMAVKPHKNTAMCI